MVGKISGVIAVILFLSTAIAAAAAESIPPKAGSTLPEIDLPVPDNSADRKYLGLSSGGKTFQVGRIKAKIVIIQIYSMYCPYCQADAPNVNRLYGLVESNPALTGKVKIIGIGAGNTSFEVATYKKKYSVAFPLIPDADFKIHKVVGEVRTPYFIAVKITDGGRNEVVYSRLGALKDVEQFLEQIVRTVRSD